jgi:DNA-binding transcriptional MerR regulator
MMQRGKSKYTIGELSKISNLKIKTLRFYDIKGLLKPSERDYESNYRYYSEQQILEALMIREMKLRGFTLLEMKQLFQSHDLSTFKVNLDNKIASVEKEIELMQEQLQYTHHTCNLIIDALSILNESKKENITDTFQITTVPETTVLFTRYSSKVNAKELFWDRYAEIYNLRDQEKAVACGPFTAIFHDHYFNQFFFEQGDLEIILPIVNGDLTKPYVKTSGGFLFASKLFVGRYADLLPTYVELVKTIEENNYQIIGPAIEQYLVEFSYGVSEDDCVTRVGFPVQKRTG